MKKAAFRVSLLSASSALFAADWNADSCCHVFGGFTIDMHPAHMLQLARICVRNSVAIIFISAMNLLAHHESKLSHASRVLWKGFRIFAWICVAFLVLLFACTVLHVGFHWCPLHFARYGDNQVVPVKYGLFLFDDALEKQVREGKVILGGCVAGPIGGVCPYCHWPVQLRR
jgi:hypothetical protein